MGKEIKDMTDRELLIRTVTRLDAIDNKLRTMCKKVSENTGEIHELKEKEANRAGREDANKDTNGNVIAIAALIISTVAIVSNILIS
jgi:hypothetical protein